MYDKIVAVGEGHGLVHAGLKALASLRMEKGYRDYGHDLDNTDTLLEAGEARHDIAGTWVAFFQEC